MHIISNQRFYLRTLLSVCACAAAFSVGNQAFASDGTITINGVVRANTCIAAAAAGTSAPTSGSISLTLKLPSISYTQISAPNTGAANTPFTIGVYNCGTSAATINVSFDVGSGMNTSGVMTNTGNANPSAVAFRIMNSNQTLPVTTGTTPNGAAVPVNQTTGIGSQTFYVQYYNYSAGTTLTSGMAGTVLGSVTYTIIYT